MSGGNDGVSSEQTLTQIFNCRSLNARLLASSFPLRLARPPPLFQLARHAPWLIIARRTNAPTASLELFLVAWPLTQSAKKRTRRLWLSLIWFVAFMGETSFK